MKFIAFRCKKYDPIRLKFGSLEPRIGGLNSILWFSYCNFMVYFIKYFHLNPFV